MKITGPILYLTDAEKQRLTQNLVLYLEAAKSEAKKFVVGGEGVVKTWFGALDADRKSSLVDKLDAMILALGDYTVKGKSYERTVQLCQSSGKEVHSDSQTAASFSLGVKNINSHFTLRVYVGLLFKKRTYDDKVQTIVHELSHRILDTDDVANAVCSGADEHKCYGIANAKALAALSPAPAKPEESALNNADNFAYYVCECNDLINT